MIFPNTGDSDIRLYVLLEFPEKYHSQILEQWIVDNKLFMIRVVPHFNLCTLKTLVVNVMKF